MATIYKVVQLEVGQSYIKFANNSTDQNHIVSIIPFAGIRMGQELCVDLGGIVDGAAAGSILSIQDRALCLVPPISSAITGATIPNIKLHLQTLATVDRVGAPNDIIEQRKMVFLIWDGTYWVETSRTTIVD